MNLPLKQPSQGGGGNSGGVGIGVPHAPSEPTFTVGEVGFGRSWQDEEPGLRALYEEAQAQIAIYEVERGILEKEMRLLREDVAKYRATRLTHEDEQILAKGHQGHAKAAVTEGGTGYSGAERPEPSPQLNNIQQALHMAAQRARVQAGVFKLEDLRDNSRWSIFNEGRAQALEKFAEELEGRL